MIYGLGGVNRRAVEAAFKLQLSLAKAAGERRQISHLPFPLPTKENAVAVKTNVTKGKKKKDPLDTDIRANLHHIKRGRGEMQTLLYDLLRLQTPYGLESFIKRIVIRELGHVKQDHYEDTMGSLHVLVPSPEGEKPSKSVFSCHMDTVHPWPNTGYDVKTEMNKYTKKDVTIRSRKDPGDVKHCIKQDLFITGKRFPAERQGYVYAGVPTLDANTGKTVYKPCVLGSDDKVGVYICLRLIRARVPGLYLFHVGEEAGCKGSGHIKVKYADKLKKYDRCIAFDRMGYTDVITKQRGNRCASIKFGQQVANVMDKIIPPAMAMDPDTTGVYTDSAEYLRLIPECLNLSVGYFNQHSDDEHFDLVWLEDILIPGLLQIKWEELKAHRNPTLYENAYAHNNHHHQGNYEHFGQSQGQGSGMRSNEPWKKIMCSPNTVSGLTANSPLPQVPNFSPLRDGFLEFATEPAMNRLIRAWDIREDMGSRSEEMYKVLKAQSEFDYRVIDLLTWIEQQDFDMGKEEFDDLPHLLQVWIADAELGKEPQEEEDDEGVSVYPYEENEDLEDVPMIGTTGKPAYELVHYKVKADLTQSIIKHIKSAKVKLPDELISFTVQLKRDFRKGKAEVVEKQKVPHNVELKLDEILANYIVIGTAFCNGDVALLKAVNRSLEYTNSNLEKIHTQHLNAEIARIYRKPDYDAALLQRPTTNSA